MGILSRIFGVSSKEELNGIRLNQNECYWEIFGETSFSCLFQALVDLLPNESILYFEGGSPSGKLLEFINNNSIPEQIHIAVGTIWPKPKCYHVPASGQNLSKLKEISNSIADPELAVHFHVYKEEEILLEWHDAFSNPMLLSGKFNEEKIKQFSDKLGMKYKPKKGS